MHVLLFRLILLIAMLLTEPHYTARQATLPQSCYTGGRCVCGCLSSLYARWAWTSPSVLANNNGEIRSITTAGTAARVPGFSVGDGVHVRKPVHVPKTFRRFSPPQQIISRKGPTYYRLEDGSVKKTAHLAWAALNNFVEPPLCPASKQPDAADDQAGSSPSAND